MNNESTFRIVLAVSILVVLPISAWHRLRARTGERLDRRQEGVALAVSLRLLGFLHMLGLLCYVLRAEWLAWSAVPLPVGWRWTGVPLGFAAACLIGWTLHHLGPNLTDTVLTRERHSLVTTGPYRWIRHPFYLGVGVAILANSLVAANLFLLATGGSALALIVRRTRREEAKLLERFGEDYRSYMKRTGRFLPRLGR